MLDELAEYSPAVQPALAPHGIYTVSEPTLGVGRRAVGNTRRAGAHPLPRDPGRGDGLRRPHGRAARRVPRPARHALAAAAPRARRVDGGAGARARRPNAARPSSPIRSPTSSSPSGASSRTRRCAAHGIPVGLGTDGASSNNSLDLLADVKVLALRPEVRRPTTRPRSRRREAWQVATGALAPAARQHSRPRGGGARRLPPRPRRPHPSSPLATCSTTSSTPRRAPSSAPPLFAAACPDARRNRRRKRRRRGNRGASTRGGVRPAPGRTLNRRSRG